MQLVSPNQVTLIFFLSFLYQYLELDKEWEIKVQEPAINITTGKLH
jgi:hypothetical protein